MRRTSEAYGDLQTGHEAKSAGALLSVLRLASELPDWVPVLQAACACAAETEAAGGVFCGTQVLKVLERQTGRPAWLPGLHALVRYGLLEKRGRSTRKGHRAYYRICDRLEIEHALEAMAPTL
jgi:hypothetical protein